MTVAHVSCSMIFASRDIPGEFSRFDFPSWLPAPWCGAYLAPEWNHLQLPELQPGA